ncbi:hypothetical protein [Novosphingobium resinovorum]|uniref:hypothetical protein n=1 Tax=Novosphingobium resinovorum TaxID=158500 RepID=UPI002ED45B64|nr:hypothetical protein [Novosphingobium resinovorum]
MTTGTDIPFRRSRFARGTGSLILDRQRDTHLREAREQDAPMRIWNKGRFVDA